MLEKMGYTTAKVGWRKPSKPATWSWGLQTADASASLPFVRTNVVARKKRGDLPSNDLSNFSGLENRVIYATRNCSVLPSLGRRSVCWWALQVDLWAMSSLVAFGVLYNAPGSIPTCREVCRVKNTWISSAPSHWKIFILWAEYSIGTFTWFYLFFIFNIVQSVSPVSACASAICGDRSKWLLEKLERLI